MGGAHCISEPLSAFSQVICNIIENSLPIPKVNQVQLPIFLHTEKIQHAKHTIFILMCTLVYIDLQFLDLKVNFYDF